LFTQNTLKGSRKNIHAHYDLGNDFYKLWLDQTMTYSSAIFHDQNDDLEKAQHSKYDRIINRLGASGRVLEIGCGWGGFAERALQTRDYAIKGLTISNEQHAFATERLGQKAEIALEDYRLQTGRYDNIVSIEMFEAVGENYWPLYFNKLKSLLADNGKALVQTITIGEDYFDRYRQGGDAIRTFIFPGGMLPSPKRFEEESVKAGFKLTDAFAFGQDYARTLELWLERFEERLGEVRALGFDEKFIRMWRFYLTSCIASFKIGRTNVMQMELQHAV
jgi:cyclopropane-fatty-acyl-phospholipid synthase